MTEAVLSEEEAPIKLVTGLSDVDLYSNGVLQLFGEICEESSLEVLTWLERLNLIAEDEEEPEPVKLVINSQGGLLTECMAIVDAIKASKVPVHTYGIGKAYSAGFMILISGHKRFASEHCDLMTHQFLGGKEGTRDALKCSREYEDRLHDMMTKLHVDNSGLTALEVEALLLKGTDTYLTPEQCLKYGLIDGIGV